MFFKVAAFELRYQLRQPLFWIVTGLFFLVCSLFAALDVGQIGGLGNIHKNSPYMVLTLHQSFALVFMFGATAFVAGAVLKDDETGFGAILKATPLGKFDYLYGRFAGAFLAAMLSFLGVTAACVLGGVAPWLDKEQLGPFMPATYLYAYGVAALPTVFMSAALFFSLATVTRSMGWTFVGVVVLVIAYLAGSMAISKPELLPLAARLDPLGFASFGLVTRYWTVTERNDLLPSLGSVFGWSRCLAVLIGVVALAVAYPMYRGRTAGVRPSKARAADAAPPARPAEFAAPRTVTVEGPAWSQLAARTAFDMSLVFKSVVFWVLLALGLGLALMNTWSVTDEGPYGGSVWPVTRILLPAIEGGFLLFAIIIAAYFAGEVVWRDRDRRMHEIIDSTPAPDWTFLAPKILAVFLVLFCALFASALAGVVTQILKGYDRFEPVKYLLWYLLPFSVDFLMIAILAVVVQVFSPNKFVGWGVMVLWFAAGIVFNFLGWEHVLNRFFRPLVMPLSDMNGMGHFWMRPWTVRLYNAGLATVLIVAAYGLWRRGAETRYRPRFQRLWSRLVGPAGWIAAAGLAVAVGAGAFIYVNTNVWNDYRTEKGSDRWLADYEKALLKYETVPQPTVTAVKLSVDIHPHQPLAEARGVYVLTNLTAAPLKEVHVRFPRDTVICALTVEGAWVKQAYDRFNYRIFTFDTPMKPGETRKMAFTSTISQRGFKNRGGLTSVVDNGTFLNSTDIGPSIGMTRGELLRDRAKRRKYHLTPEDIRPPALGQPGATNYAYVDHLGWTTADITVTTDADQTPIAPGYKVSDVTRDGRRTAEFRTEAPILQFFSIQSARYQVRTTAYKGVDLSVYFDAQHPYNVDRMLTALKASLDYYQANFSPYQFRQARIVEFPDYAEFAQSFAGTFPWSEGLGFIADYRDPEKIDMVTYIAAHEFAHQWWAHQIVGADEQGATSLSETLAQYSALRVMERMYGPEHIRKFLKFELDSYLRARGGQAVEEEPLEKVEPDQGYIHYRKGSLVMYRLADEIGEDKVNAALRSLLARFAFKGAPYPTSLDLVAALRAQAPADKQQLITDLFEKITLYDVKTTSAKSARLPDGRWRVTLTVSARKLYADGNGKETPAPMNETLWVGLFDAKPGTGAFAARNVIAMERRPIHDGVQTLTFIAPKAPTWAGADPYNELIDRNSDDNLVAVK
ncbi:MAG: aminopeptidase [Proteobacteria bacterium]|nr:aminopeptidase [Pseudomonadota bacterium]